MELRPLGSFSIGIDFDRLFMLGTTPYGNRMIQELASAELVGERVKASMKGVVGGDWASITEGGLARFDIRVLLETTDGALIYLTYTGKADWSAGLGQGPIYVTAQCETADERYTWLNTIQIVGKGGPTADATAISYELFELV
jgi:hypothetical protein